MKKLFVLFFILLSVPASAIVVNNDVPNMCGERGYDVLYADFTPISYTCNAGEYLPADSLGCANCPSRGYTCSGGTFSYNANVAQGLTANTYTCNSGYFLPANAIECTPCPDGWNCPGGTFDFNETKFSGLYKSATYMAGNENNVCASNYARKIYGIFEPISYTCNSGYFLPANAIECAPCPAGYACAGGTFVFNSASAQGLTRTETYYTVNESNACAANFAHLLNAVFVPGDVCDSGEYLPANSDECVACPNGYTCNGGTFFVNENANQGIVANTIIITWNGATSQDVAENNAGSCTYGGDIRTPKSVDQSQIPIGKYFKGWKFVKTSN